MNLPDLGLLALVEGVADILPIDASAHSMIAARLLGWRAGPLLPALHLGAALALCVYFWRDISLIVSGLLKLRKARIEPGTRLLTKLLIAALPFILARAGVGGFVPPTLTSLFWVGVVTLVCALVMLFADRLSLTVKRIEHIGGGTSLAVGVLQLVALIPGVGRVAAALTVARLFGMERAAAYRFILLSSVPVLLAEAVCDFLQGSQHPGTSDVLSLGLSFGLVLIALPIGFALIRRSGLMPFAIYRLIFGGALLGLGLL